MSASRPLGLDLAVIPAYNALMGLSLSPELQHLVKQQLASGRYHTTDEVLTEALRAFGERDAEIVDLRRELQIGIDELDQGELEEVR